MNAQSIREVQFREKVRGYHPADVDAFVASVADTVDRLERRLEETEARLAELRARPAPSAEDDDALRRTLVLAQRTADLAIQEAREEAARLLAEAHEERERSEGELEAQRQRLMQEAYEDSRSARDQLEAQRAALQADVEALRDHLARERDRLRIYFTDQLRRVDDGEPGMAGSPPMQAAPSTATATDADAVDEVLSEPEYAPDAPGAEQEPPPPGAPEDAAQGQVQAAADDDPFLAELRRAVEDERPLGPRDDTPPPADDHDDDEDPFDLFAKGEDDANRFGSRLRRRR